MDTNVHGMTASTLALCIISCHIKSCFSVAFLLEQLPLSKKSNIRLPYVRPIVVNFGLLKQNYLRFAFRSNNEFAS